MVSSGNCCDPVADRDACSAGVEDEAGDEISCRVCRAADPATLRRDRSVVSST